MTIPSKAIYRYNVILIKLSMAVFTELGQTIRNFTWDHKKSRIAKETLWRGEGVRKKAGGISLPVFREYYKATGIKSMWYLYWYKNRHANQMECNRQPRNKPTHL